MGGRRWAGTLAALLLGAALNVHTALAVEPLADPRPVLRKLIPYTLADMNHDVAGKRMEEITGYRVAYDVLPQDDPTPKLLFEVATGADYDIIKCTTEQFMALKNQGALVDLAPYLAAYGSHLGLDTTALRNQLVLGEGGEVYGLPLINNPTMENPYGMIRHGLAFRSDMLRELGLPLPRTLEELTACLRRIHEHTGVGPLTIAAGPGTVWVLPILSAYGLGEAEWYLRDGALVPRVRMPGMEEYLAYLQMLYREGLLEAEFPINKTENTIEKMATGRAYVTTMYFWDIPTLKEAFEAAGLDSGVEMAGTLRKDSRTPACYYVDYGIYYVFCIPKSARHVADAVHYLNLQSAPETFLLTYLGVEGEQYEVRDGQYHPLLPGFEEYLNAAQYTALSPQGNEFIYWQARARKTPEMSKAYDQMNGEIGNLTLIPDKSSYAFGQPGTQARADLNKLMGDMLLEAIISDVSPQEALQRMTGVWEAGGGLAFEQAMNAWYQRNKDDEALAQP
ncbi:MAG: extracellular solute-binding protein [Candidatus Limiplasma sp.]|nr:extracellular solute-binding protein [Candidatus Limiplasma sp.]